LEHGHGCINIHADNEWAFRLACKYGHLDIVKFLLTLEPDHNRIDIHVENDRAFRNDDFHIRHQLIHRDPNYNWKKIYGYEDYSNELNKIIEQLTLLHQKMVHLSTDILELNVIGIVKGYLI